MLLRIFFFFVILDLLPRIPADGEEPTRYLIPDRTNDNPCNSFSPEAGKGKSRKAEAVEKERLRMEAYPYCQGVLYRFLRHPKYAEGPRYSNAKCTRGKNGYKCTAELDSKGSLYRSLCSQPTVDLASIVTDRVFWSWPSPGINFFLAPQNKDRATQALARAEDTTMHVKTGSYAVYGVKGGRDYMEDLYAVAENDPTTGASFYAVFDGHVSEYAANYARKHLIKNIVASYKEQIDLRKNFSQSQASKRYKHQGSQRTSRTLKSTKSFGFQTNEGIDYKKLLNDVFLSTDKALCEELIALGTDSGTTAIVAMIQGTRLIVANVGDSRGVMCDSDGFVVPLSFDHKPESEDEKRRIEEAGGTVTKSHHAYRVDNYLATSRALGNCRWKPQNRIIATPDVLIFDLSEFRPQFIILATDGLWNIFTSEAAVNVIQKQFQQPFFGAQDLTRLSILWGSTDNTSIMVINLKNHAWPEKKPMEKKKSSRSLSSAFSSKRRSKSLASKSSSIRSP